MAVKFVIESIFDEDMRMKRLYSEIHRVIVWSGAA